MASIIVSEFVSLDGVMEAPGGDEPYRHAGWTFDIETDATMYDDKFEEAREAAALVLGRRTYDGFAAAWPERDGAFADRFNGMRKYVVSSTLTDPTWNNTVVVPDIESLTALRESEDGVLCVQGSQQLVQELHRRGLIDEWRLMVWPVILGSGKRIFPDDVEDKAKLRLERSSTYANGVQLQIFRPGE
jgi:dihydrofolate reductase